MAMTETVDPFCLGILSGISWVSGRDYYESINTACMDASAVCKVIRPNPLIVMVSVDCDEYAALLDARDFDTVQMYLADGVRRLVGAGANLLCIASNTGHICIPEVARRYPSLSIVHIADCTARAIVADNVAGGAEAAVDGPILVGLLGTEPTMRESYLKDRLRLHSIETIVPEADEDLAKIFNFMCVCSPFYQPCSELTMSRSTLTIIPSCFLFSSSLSHTVASMSWGLTNLKQALAPILSRSSQSSLRAVQKQSCWDALRLSSLSWSRTLRMEQSCTAARCSTVIVSLRSSAVRSLRKTWCQH
jgi:aspartate/glutamate racemase